MNLKGFKIKLIHTINFLLTFIDNLKSRGCIQILKIFLSLLREKEFIA